MRPDLLVRSSDGKMPVADKSKERGKTAVVVSMADAQRKLAREKKRRADPPPALERGGAPPGKWNADSLGLPKEDPCPVTPLGREGGIYHLIDSSGQFCSLDAKDFSHSGIQSLFAATPHWPQWAWPRFGRAAATPDGDKPKAPPIKSFDDDKTREALFMACTRKGMFSPADKLRGRGAWTLRGGQIVYHAGESIWVCEDGRMIERDLGLHEGHLYPRLPALPEPWTEPVSDDDNPAGELLDTLRKWKWERPDVDPVLMLGWIGVAFLGGALDWRSAVLLVGDKGTGKSTLQDGLKDLFGDALFHSADTTAAGIYQAMAHDTRPVAVDELEPGTDSRKVDAVTNLMRAASSGAMARRGGQTGTPSEYQMRSAFLFSAINNPLHTAQDLSRVAILRLRPLDEGQTKPPPIDGDTCGRKLLAILMREWPRFQDTRDAYMAALAAGGHDARGQKTYGTLLAAADLMLGAALADAHHVELTDNAAWWTEHLSAEALPEIEDAKPNWRNCLDHLLTVQVDPWRGGARQTIGKVLDDVETEQHASADGKEMYDFNHGRRDLAVTGIGLVRPVDLIASVARADSISMPEAATALGVQEHLGVVLAIPNRSPMLAKLFALTDWQNGSWKDALRQCPYPGIVITDKRVNRVKIAGVQQRCTLVVMKKYQEAPER